MHTHPSVQVGRRAAQPFSADNLPMQALPDTFCFLNGDYTALQDARISVLDRGFIFGDGIYEVIPVYGGRLFRFDEHIARLGRSLAEVQMANPHTAEEWRDIADNLIQRNPSTRESDHQDEGVLSATEQERIRQLCAAGRERYGYEAAAASPPEKAKVALD